MRGNPLFMLGGPDAFQCRCDTCKRTPSGSGGRLCVLSIRTQQNVRHEFTFCHDCLERLAAVVGEGVRRQGGLSDA